MSVMAPGGCFCGNVRYEAQGEPEAQIVCHCLDCRKISGSTYSCNGLYPGEAFKVTKGTPKEHKTKSASGSEVTSGFCGDCGSTMFRYGNTFGDKRVMGTLDDTNMLNNFKANAELFVKDKPQWVGARLELVDPGFLDQNVFFVELLNDVFVAALAVNVDQHGFDGRVAFDEDACGRQYPVTCLQAEWTSGYERAGKGHLTRPTRRLAASPPCHCLATPPSILALSSLYAKHCTLASLTTQVQYVTCQYDTEEIALVILASGVYDSYIVCLTASLYLYIRALNPPSSSMAPSPIPATVHAHMALAACLPAQAHISVRHALASLAARDEDEFHDENDNFSTRTVELDPVHYYFVLLLTLLVTVGLLAWLICWRRRRSRKSGRLGEQQARAMNVQAWTLHGAGIPNNATLVSRNSSSAQYDDAPPPYQGKTDATPPYPSIPLRALSRDENDPSRPPQYTEHNGTRAEVV
ncbi:glutathione-dependent formaldehyde-activating [Pyrenophora seminiperda CCB06]|uniref:Glutathione-dependent formaldehyde-activating n=1 Tax=Pyrenophora seminiperda CCB06 TaxID=1302712 RepID=A0A3M7MJA1_9PLEO|nr:glutathione-dependent formaldehyde-activating [Pyrenophora seminiperda CCB06]